ncbi:MAG: glycosyltransferase family 2 protein [Verrucomicrobiae bacterium]|nr:glycosyltransferase family 2 protein [Verrucomicrobiae bacterium]
MILLIVTLVLWAAGFALLPRLRRCGRDTAFPPVQDVSVIIPARNEAHNLPKLLDSIAQQSVQPREVIVVNDASTDATAEVAARHGARVLNSKPLPPGWRGKTWACHQGAQAAKGRWLLFLDADTWFEPDGLARALAFANASPDRPSSGDQPGAHTAAATGPMPHGAFSIGPYHVVRRPYEQLSLFFNLSMVVGTVPERLFGQMLLVDRDSYRRVGGHEAVKERTLENFHLAQLFRAAGIPTRSTSGRGILAFRMYPNGPGELIEGWTKGFASGAGQTPRGVLAVVVVWMIGLMLPPLGGLLSGQWLTWSAVYLLCAAQVGWFARMVGSFHWLTALVYPVALIFFFIVMARSALRSGKTVTWKGREIRAD